MLNSRLLRRHLYLIQINLVVISLWLKDVMRLSELGGLKVLPHKVFAVFIAATSTAIVPASAPRTTANTFA
jgi:hypothetical protein